MCGPQFVVLIMSKYLKRVGSIKQKYQFEMVIHEVSLHLANPPSAIAFQWKRGICFNSTLSRLQENRGQNQSNSRSNGKCKSDRPYHPSGHSLLRF